MNKPRADGWYYVADGCVPLHFHDVLMITEPGLGFGCDKLFVGFTDANEGARNSLTGQLMARLVCWQPITRPGVKNGN